MDDYARWRTLEDARISGDGRWVAYPLRHTNVLPSNAKPVLHICDIQTGRDVEITDAHDPVFSPDSRWVVYQVDSIPARGGRGGRGGAPADSAATPDSANRRAPAVPPRAELR